MGSSIKGNYNAKRNEMAKYAYREICLYQKLAEINKFDIKTPGRDIGWGAEAGTTIDSNNKVDASINTSTIVEGLGGKNNIKTIGCCITRLRTIVNDTSLVNDEILKTVENKGIIKKGNEVQIVIGMKVQDVCSDVKSYLKIED